MIDGTGMGEAQSEPASEWIRSLGSGDAGATAALVPLVYDELRRLARAHLSREREAATLQPTALVHEAFVRLVGDKAARWDNRQHFFGAAALAMRRILVERARARRRLKRGGGVDREDAELDAFAAGLEHADEEVLALEDALERLSRTDPKKSEVVHLRYFLGLSIEETADALAISPTTVKAHWTFARAWLKREIENAEREP